MRTVNAFKFLLIHITFLCDTWLQWREMMMVVNWQYILSLENYDVHSVNDCHLCKTYHQYFRQGGPQNTIIMKEFNRTCIFRQHFRKKSLLGYKHDLLSHCKWVHNYYRSIAYILTLSVLVVGKLFNDQFVSTSIVFQRKFDENPYFFSSSSFSKLLEDLITAFSGFSLGCY